MYDYLNRKHRRNQYNTKILDYNCGGYALGTYNWYFPYNYDREVTVEELIYEGFNEEEIYNILLKEDVDNMLYDFEGRLRLINTEEEANSDEIVIAYRIFIDFCLDNNKLYYEDSDFHYRVKNNGVWFEKNGDSEIHIVKEDITEPWIAQCGTYDSDLVLMALKI